MGLSPTTVKVFRIIELISKNVEGLTLSEISSRLHLPVSTVFDILYTLVEQDVLVIKNSRLKTYSIGPKLYIYGSTYVKSSNLLNFSKKYLENLANENEVTSFVYKFNNEHVVIVYKYESQNAKIITKSVGELIKLHSSAAGKIFVAYDPLAYHTFEQMKLEQETSYTITDKDQLLAQIEEVRKNGIALDIRETENHLVSIACPIFDNKDKRLAGVIGVKMLYIENEDYSELAEKLIKISEKITEELISVEQYY